MIMHSRFARAARRLLAAATTIVGALPRLRSVATVSMAAETAEEAEGPASDRLMKKSVQMKTLMTSK